MDNVLRVRASAKLDGKAKFATNVTAKTRHVPITELAFTDNATAKPDGKETNAT